MWICIAPRREHNTPLRRSRMARVLKGSHRFKCTPRTRPHSETATTTAHRKCYGCWAIAKIDIAERSDRFH